MPLLELVLGVVVAAALGFGLYTIIVAEVALRARNRRAVKGIRRREPEWRKHTATLEGGSSHLRDRG